MTYAQRIQFEPPSQSVRSTRALSINIVLVLLLPGCMSPLGDKQEIPETDCQLEPTAEGCFELVVTEDDCKSSQIFTGESCRTMLGPVSWSTDYLLD